MVVNGWTAAMLGAGLGLACGGQGAFLCSTDSQCGGEGLCQPEGFCSFAATDCPSGQRFGDNSGPTSGQCVETAGTTGGGEPSPQGSGSEAAGEDTGLADTAATLESTSTDSAEDDTIGTESSGGPEVDPDLVLWLRLEDAVAPPYVDSSTYGNDGTCLPENCPVAVQGRVGAAASFDGVDDHIAVPDSPSFETPQGFTLALWTRLDGLPESQAALLTKPVGGNAFNTWELYFGVYQDALPLLQLSMGDGDGADLTAATQGPFVVGEWFHVAGRWDGAEMTLFVDGRAVATQANTAYAIDSHPIYVGADDDNVDGVEAFYPGSIDDVRVYRRALDDTEIQALATSR